MKGFLTEKTIWRIVDSHWINIERIFINAKHEESHELYSGVLADYLWLIGFDIPDCIQYCLAENDEYKLKFRKHGGLITIFINPL